MRTILILSGIAAMLCFTVATSIAQEELTAHTPTPAPATARLRIIDLRLRLPGPDVTFAGPAVYVELVELDGSGACVRDENQCRRIEVSYSGAEAVAMINQLNRSDFSSVSLVRRLYQRLLADGKISGGAIGGAPLIPTPTVGQ